MEVRETEEHTVSDACLCWYQKTEIHVSVRGSERTLVWWAVCSAIKLAPEIPG